MTQAAAKPADIVYLDRHRKRKPLPDRPGPPSRKLTVLPTVRPAPPPPPTGRKTELAFCNAGQSCVAYPSLNSPARLNRYNTTRVGEALYCYGCREKIARERTADTAARRSSEVSAAGRHVSRAASVTRTAPQQANPPLHGAGP